MPFGVYLWGRHVATYSDDFKECVMARDRDNTAGSAPVGSGQGPVNPPAKPAPAVKRVQSPLHPNIALLAKLDRELAKVSAGQRKGTIIYLFNLYCTDEPPPPAAA